MEAIEDFVVDNIAILSLIGGGILTVTYILFIPWLELYAKKRKKRRRIRSEK